ncbi:lipoprotein [Klebsiella michiganensis]|uniref:Lipoprotein n=1 Tax=Klebsiella michiganensis TaxID=1134687 RepID=A0A7H4N0D8_9ENTR|nr:lipoprotein [Klebsiella michiganensis]
MLNQPEPGKPKLLGIKLYVYGFSRGAAAARAFVNWLVELLPGVFRKGAKPDLCLTLEGADWKVPLSVEFSGTVGYGGLWLAWRISPPLRKDIWAGPIMQWSCPITA